MNRFSASTLQSVLVHAALAGAVSVALMESDGLQGDAGLAGALHAKTVMMIEMAPIDPRSSEIKRVAARAPKPVAPPPSVRAAANEGLAIAKPAPRLQHELPTAVKNPEIREIDTPPDEIAQTAPEESPPLEVADTIAASQSMPTPARGDSADGETANLGQEGSSNQAAPKIGTGARRDSALGLYLERLRRKAQAALRAPGMLDERRQTMLRIRLLPSGNVGTIDVIRTSGDRRLDRLAVDAVKRAQPYGPLTGTQDVELPVHFNLTQR